MEFYSVKVTIKNEKGFEKREYFLIAPNEEFVKEKVLTSLQDQMGAQVDSVEKLDCFMLRIK